MPSAAGKHPCWARVGGMAVRTRFLLEGTGTVYSYLFLTFIHVLAHVLLLFWGFNFFSFWLHDNLKLTEMVIWGV